MAAIPPEFLAQGFDTVLVAREWPGGLGIDWVRDFLARRGFAPLIYMSGQAAMMPKRRRRSRSARTRLWGGPRSITGS